MSDKMNMVERELEQLVTIRGESIVNSLDVAHWTDLNSRSAGQVLSRLEGASHLDIEKIGKESRSNRYQWRVSK